MKYERFTRRAENGKPYFDGCLCCNLESDCGLCPYWASGLNRLAELEDKIEQGTLIELPCKVGDTVYAVKKEALRGHWDEHRYIVDDWDKWKVCKLPFSLTLWECGGVVGKDYFLTREEAEKRLKELQNG